MLKKEVMKTQSKELEKGQEYRQLLVQVPAQASALTACFGSGIPWLGQALQCFLPAVQVASMRSVASWTMEQAQEKGILEAALHQLSNSVWQSMPSMPAYQLCGRQSPTYAGPQGCMPAALVSATPDMTVG